MTTEMKHLNNFINNMKPSQQSTGATNNISGVFHLFDRTRASVPSRTSDAGPMTIRQQMEASKASTSQRCHQRPQLHRVHRINDTIRLTNMLAQQRQQQRHLPIQLHLGSIRFNSVKQVQQEGQLHRTGAIRQPPSGAASINMGGFSTASSWDLHRTY